MKILLLVGFLLGFTLTACRSVSIPQHHADNGNDNDNDNDKDDNSDEYEHVETELWFHDDNEKPVKADLEKKGEDEDDLETTKNDLANRVLFYLYTRKNPSDYQQLYVNDEETLTSSNFETNKPTRIVTHGWMNSYNSSACTLIRDAYVKNGDYNVIIVDWSAIAKKFYLYSSNRVRMVGSWVATMIDFLEKQGVDLSETILVGHSLGAHVVGLAGSEVSGTVGYIVGLDPAMPLFLTVASDARISKGDATYVQIIHTNAGFLGFKSAIGNSDFYPNGGFIQNGCIIDIGGSCSHSRSYKYFAESINSVTGFYGRSCRSFWRFLLGLCSGNELQMMGGSKPNVRASGRYYLETHINSPYAKGD